MKRKGLFKRSLAFLLTSVMTIGLVSYMPNDVTKVQAEETKTIAGLGTSAIANPTSSEDKWSGSYVYFGTYNNSPVKYRVLAKETTDFSEEKDGSKPKTMLLDSDSILEKRVFYSSSNVWENSDIKKYLNSEGDYAEDKKGFLKSSFSALEQAAIAESATSASEEKTNGKFGYANLNGEKIFLLDVKEATNTSYGIVSSILCKHFFISCSV